MARKLDARAAAFSPSFGTPPSPQQLQQQHQRHKQQNPGTHAITATAVAGGQARSRSRSNSQGQGQGHGQGPDHGHGGGNSSSSAARAGDSKSVSRRRGSGGQDPVRGSTSTRTSGTTPLSRGTLESSHQAGGGGSGGTAGKGRGKGGSAARGGNANHLLNFQFQPRSSGGHQGEGVGGRGRRRSGAGGSGRNKGGGVWGGSSTRGPMSKEQFLQANFHFLLHDPGWRYGDTSSSSPALQEAFFDPDVLVDWDTVDTVRLFRKVRKRSKAPPSSSSSGVGQGPSCTATVAACAPNTAAAPNAGTTSVSGEMQNGVTKHTPVETASPAPGHGNPVADFEGLTVLSSSKEEVSWGGGKKHRDGARAETVRDTDTVKLTVQQPAAEGNIPGATGPSALKLNVTGGGRGGVGNGNGGQEEEEEEEGEWRCSICLDVPIVPRISKCGHGPFCLVCILRHLKGEETARCPLCFDKMHRDQLRRVARENVRPHVPGVKANLVLLQRERTSLVPVRASGRDDLRGEGVRGQEASKLPRGTAAAARAQAQAQGEALGNSRGGDHVSGGGRQELGGGDGDEHVWWAGVCPKEGDDSERFSRLVRADPSTLRDMAAAEHFALLRFRHESMKSGETEWIPFVSQAQALVNVQLGRFSAMPPPCTPITAVGHNDPRKGQGALAVGARGTSCTTKGGSSLGADGVSTQGGMGREGGGVGVGGVDVKDAPRVAAAVSAATAERGTKVKNGSGTAAVGGSNVKHMIGEAENAVLDTSTAATAAMAGATAIAETGSGGGGGGGPFRFFQSSDGQKAFLHPLNMRQLLDDVERGLPLPQEIDAQVLEVETVKLTPELRRRLPFLAHLPIHCDLAFVEVDMADLVSEASKQKFREEILKREKKRRSRAAAEARAARKEARLEQDRADRVAAMRTFTVDLQGPTPGGAEESTQSTSHPEASSNPDDSASPRDGEGRGAEDDPAGAAASSADAASAGLGHVSSGSTRSYSAGAGGGAAGGTVNGTERGGGSSAPGTGGTGEGTGWSFARVTAMNGHFPTLNSSTAQQQAVATASLVQSNGSQPAAAWGGTAAAGTAGGSTPVYGGPAGEGTGAWGSTTAVDAVTEGRTLVEREGGAPQTSGGESGGGGGGGAPNHAGRKKGRKGKAVSLFSNAGVRGGAR